MCVTQVPENIYEPVHYISNIVIDFVNFFVTLPKKSACDLNMISFDCFIFGVPVLVNA